MRTKKDSKRNEWKEAAAARKSEELNANRDEQMILLVAPRYYYIGFIRVRFIQLLWISRKRDIRKHNHLLKWDSALSAFEGEQNDGIK